MTDKKEKEDYDGIAPVSSIVKKMKKEYDSDSKGWRVIGSKDKDGNSDTLITKKPNSYWLKSKQINPYSSLTMGSVVRNLDRDIDEKIGKKLSPDDMLRFFGMVVPLKNDKNIIAAGIEKYSQQHGDYLKKVIKERDANLGFQLRRKIDDEFTRKYHQRKNLYI